jgi:hypothetical protein
VIAELAWEPPRPRLTTTQTVEVRVAFAKAMVRHRVTQAGARWSPDPRQRKMRYQQAGALKLEARIVGESSIQCWMLGATL